MANNTPFDNTGFKGYTGFIEQPEIGMDQYISITNWLIGALEKRCEYLCVTPKISMLPEQLAIRSEVLAEKSEVVRQI